MNKLLLKIFCATAFLLGFQLYSSGQSRTVTGTVSELVNGKKSPVSGVGVFFKGNPSVGAATDNDGGYSLSFPDSDKNVILFSCLGYDDMEVELAAGQTVLDVTLNFADEQLDELVVVGYGYQKRSDVAGSVASIKTEELVAYPSTSVAEMMRGRASGVQVTTTSGAPGSNSKVQIRGVRSLLDGSNAPMYVIDGVVATEIEFNAVSPSDVESMEILKDAASQAIYGARAANGVIIITTKKGAREKAVVSFNATLSSQHLWRNFDLYNSDEYFELRRQAVAHDNGIDDPAAIAAMTAHEVLVDNVMEEMYSAGKHTDWESLMFSPALMQKYEVNVRGRGDKYKVAATAGYLDQDGMVNIGSRFTRGNVRLNFEYDITKWLTMGFNSSYIKQTNLSEPDSFNSYLIVSPLGKPYDEEGNPREYINSFGDKNPLHNAKYYKSQTDGDMARLNGYLEARPVKGLSYKFQVGYYNEFQEKSGYKKKEYTGGGAAGSITDTKMFHYLVENQVNYQVPFSNEDFSLNLTAVQSYEHQTTGTVGFGANNVPVDSFWWDMIQDGVNSSMNHTFSEYYIMSYLARAQFGYKGRYLLNLAMRRDGCSRFGKNHKWGNFPSVSAAWRISQEPWMKDVDWVSNLKLRVSYGLVGNMNGIGNYETLGTVSGYEYEFGSTYYPGYLPGTSLPNVNLKWESTASANFAIDFGLFNNRINGTVEYYNTNTNNLLFKRQINSVLGYLDMRDNVASTNTNGIDLNINGDIIRQKNIGWNVGLTYSLFKNKITSLSGELDENGKPIDDLTNLWFIGQPINILYQYKTDGILQYEDFTGQDESGKWILKNTVDTDNDGIADAPLQRDDNVEPGKVKVVDVDGDGRITADDRCFFKKDPDFVGSVNTSLRLWNFDLFMDWYGVFGPMKNNQYLYDSNHGGSLQGKNNGIKVDYWTPDHPSNTAPRPSHNFSTTYHKDLSLCDASYIRLRTLSLGYQLPQKVINNIGLSAAKITLTATNLLTFTKYKSYSPEAAPGTYPEARQYAASLSITF